MAYATYTTEAFVCGSKLSNTSDKSYLLFTEEAGMLWATARSVREERSKQRYALQDFSYIRVSLVRGKSGWRIGSVESLNNVFMEAGDRNIRTSIARIVKLLRRLVHGEDPQSELFNDLRMTCQLLAKGIRDSEALEQVFTLRTLNTLGYIAPQADFNAYLEGELIWHDERWRAFESSHL